jgi:hypothetical protein
MKSGIGPGPDKANALFTPGEISLNGGSKPSGGGLQA